MTPLLNDVEAGASSIGRGLARIVAGILISASGGYPEYIELKQPPFHAVHVLIFAGIVLFGVIVSFWPYVKPVIDEATPRAQKISVSIFNRRAGDAQGPTTITVTPPQPPQSPPPSEGPPS